MACWGNFFALALCIQLFNVSVLAFDRRRFPGPYCKTRAPRQCCAGRDDECTVPIHDTLCYCDQFCEQHSVEDCCPDYEDTCSFRPQTTTTRPQNDNQCLHDDRLYQVGDIIKNGCNDCWTSRTYSKFDGVALRDGSRYYLGTTQPKAEVVRLNPLLINPDDNYDLEFFDSREQWPGYIHSAMDQGECAASWAFSTAGVAADRWSIQSKGVFTDQMSVQNIISCDRVNGCDGGRVEDAWYFLQRFGAAEEQCYPYTSGSTRDKGQCRYLDELFCPNGRPAHEHKTTPPYRIAANERQIMEEIHTQGPVQAIMTVYPDFYLYESGIYRHSGKFHGDHSVNATHSVKIIGWGVDNGIKYWRCVNSWGTRWGEDGTFRILRGDNESGIEGFVIGVWPRVEQHELHHGEDHSKRRKHRQRRH